MVNTQLANSIVLITGASSGIGAACARTFSAAGAKVIVNARTRERLKPVIEELSGEVYALSFDVCDRAAVESAIASLPESWRAIDILINNAGLSRGLDKLYEGSIQDWEEMIDTNIKGLLYVSRAVVPGMVDRAKGHIINIGSTAGHQTYPGGNVYCATKAAVKSITEGLKQDVLGTPIRVSAVDPGLVETDFSNVRFHGDRDRASQVYRGLTPLTPADVADVILFCVTRPPHVNLMDIVMMPVDQAPLMLFNRQNEG
ncbi:SDR family NAD(P)-dependent oxidoreductase [Oscillatoria sp. FACHB-1406]|nr:SDR family NAD(P)-dependent oxidoreductase [Oscillatoria sp. FACHB-1406]